MMALVVLLPLTEQVITPDEYLRHLEQDKSCTGIEECRISIVETVPIGVEIPPQYEKPETIHEAWLELINLAEEKIEIISHYWMLRLNAGFDHFTSIVGEEIFQAIYRAGKYRGVQIKIAQNRPNATHNNGNDTKILALHSLADVRTVNLKRLKGSGLLHIKLWLIDRKHFYIGSANADWRSLKYLKELGIVAYDCPCLAKDMAKIFDMYWLLGGRNATIPTNWPAELSTRFNAENPMRVNVNGHNYLTYIASSPPPLRPFGRSDDLDTVVDIIKSAKEFIYVSVTHFFPLLLYTEKLTYWPRLDNALRSAALENNVTVRILISYTTHDYQERQNNFLRSLTVLSPKIEARGYVVPKRPRELNVRGRRVDHCRYLVTDRVAYVGTANWSGDYFETTAGVGIAFQEPEEKDNMTTTSGQPGIRQQMKDVFERDWDSPHIIDIEYKPNKG